MSLRGKLSWQSPGLHVSFLGLLEFTEEWPRPWAGGQDWASGAERTQPAHVCFGEHCPPGRLGGRNGVLGGARVTSPCTCFTGRVQGHPSCLVPSPAHGRTKSHMLGVALGGLGGSFVWAPLPGGGGSSGSAWGRGFTCMTARTWPPCKGVQPTLPKGESPAPSGRSSEGPQGCGTLPADSSRTLRAQET